MPDALRRGVCLKSLLIVYHSMTGATRHMAQAVARGAEREKSLRVVLRPAAEADTDALLEASAYVFASPENLAAMSGQMKDFFDRTYYAALDRLNGRPYALVVCAGSDGRSAVQQLERIATGWRLNAVAPALIVRTQARTAEEILRMKTLADGQLRDGEELGATLAAGTALGIF